jgi:hypothetical protein
MLACTERLLLEAKVLTRTQVLAAAGDLLDQKNEVLGDRAGVRLWNAWFLGR